MGLGDTNETQRQAGRDDDNEEMSPLRQGPECHFRPKGLGVFMGTGSKCLLGALIIGVSKARKPRPQRNRLKCDFEMSLVQVHTAQPGKFRLVLHLVRPTPQKDTSRWMLQLIHLLPSPNTCFAGT